MNIGTEQQNRLVLVQFHTRGTECMKSGKCEAMDILICLLFPVRQGSSNVLWAGFASRRHLF